ncbi:hypothetical protein OEZ85_007071 [Tetradesmus obliquus]|uniref:PIH1D1/2/3 CS-like domain-containing protein n=1 Tax=Tetradesmus obliquus TaxID=3088 RepID=A0ABY8TWL4_TETOB|nr:hypothetical protein OEZ85_007071 [Tetradesmus obliquus]
MNSLAEFSMELEALAKLLNHQEAVLDDAPRKGDLSKPSATPASIGPQDLLPVKVASPKARKKNDIWTAEEASCSGYDDDADDGREVPEFELRYKQAVTTSDNFLGMSGKDPSSSCCEELLVVLQLPHASSAAELDLDVTATHLRLSSPIYKLSTHLPHKVNHEHGKAKVESGQRATERQLNSSLRHPLH